MIATHCEEGGRVPSELDEEKETFTEAFESNAVLS